ncbi:MAG: SGNH/GDSL hydrolase family protein [Sphingomonadales bacterium]|nr:SGNH/GDSL hydrolase family protein [Sphingomonadales bacterium]
MKRVSIFAKGNVDVHDSLHSCRIGGKLLWNGINDSVRADYPDANVRLRHETLTRFDALLAAGGHVPPELEALSAPLGNYPLASQFSDRFYTTPVDAVVLSILPDVAATLLRHKREGFLFYPADTAQWSEDERIWLRANFEHTGFSSVDQSMQNLASVVERLREARDVPVLVYNMSPIIPGDLVHCHLGLDESYSTRIRRFNLALIELSQAIGISIVDLDAIVAREGANRMKVDAMHLTPEGYRQVAREVVRILDDLGVLEGEPVLA